MAVGLDTGVPWVKGKEDNAPDPVIITRANELGDDPLSLSNRFCNEFHADVAYLHCLPPPVEPCVSTHIDQIIDMIKQGLVPLLGSNNESCCRGLDGLASRSAEYYKQGARFVKCG